MALKILQPGIYPAGQFDMLDSQVNTVKGGEVGQFVYVSRSTAPVDEHAKDIDDGYVSNTTLNRPAVTTTLVAGTGASLKPLFLLDEGIANYGTLIGQVVGSNVGQDVSNGVQVGPTTMSGSGKCTVWDKAGFYAVTLDACDVNGTTGLQPTNTSLTGNDALYATSAGLLTPTVGSAYQSTVVGRFIEFSTNGSLVSTPASLVRAANSPVSQVSPFKAGTFTQAVFHFDIGL